MKRSSPIRLWGSCIYSTLLSDVPPPRNAGNAVSALNEGRSPLLLTERVEHLERLAQRLSPWVKDLVVLHGGMGQKALRDNRARLAKLSGNTGCLVLATGRYVVKDSMIPG
jgi:hypothetical protein